MDNIWIGPWAIFPQYVDGAFVLYKNPLKIVMVIILDAFILQILDC